MIPAIHAVRSGSARFRTRIAAAVIALAALVQVPDTTAAPAAASVSSLNVTAARAGDTTILLPACAVPAGAQLSIVTPPKRGTIIHSFSTGSGGNQWAAIYRVEVPPAGGQSTDAFSYAIRSGGKQIGKPIEVRIAYSEPHPKLAWIFHGSEGPVAAGSTAKHVLRVINLTDTTFSGDLPPPPAPWSTSTRKLEIPGAGKVDLVLTFSPTAPRVHAATWGLDPAEPRALAILTGFTPGSSTLPSVTAKGSRGAASGGALKLSANPPILYIGDSLSVGGFGEIMQATLLKGVGPKALAMYASGGSSVQSWMAAHATYMTHCGYRETRPGKAFLDEKCGPVYATPKIEQILPACRPEILIIQLGTNHFDTVAEGGKGCLPAQQRLLDSFAASIRKHGKTVKLVIWITPPDSAKFSADVENTVTQLIIDLCTRNGFSWVDSRKYTRYVPGKSGSDGVHYSDADARKWAMSVINAVNAIINRTGWHR